MKIAICDDDNSFLQNVKFLINKVYSNPDKLSIYEYESGEQFLLQFKPQFFDVIILDIEMCGITGLEVAEEIRKIDKSVILAFLTSHQEFATLGYEVNAFRYILKNQPEHMFVNHLKSIFDEYHQSHITFPVQASNEIVNILVSDILYFEIFKRTVVLHTIKKEYQFNGKPSEIEKDERLVNFIKPHKNYYVNLDWVDTLKPTGIFMKNGDVIPLSRNQRHIVTDRFVSFLTARC